MPVTYNVCCRSSVGICGTDWPYVPLSPVVKVRLVVLMSGVAVGLVASMGVGAGADAEDVRQRVGVGHRLLRREVERLRDHRAAGAGDEEELACCDGGGAGV